MSIRRTLSIFAAVFALALGTAHAEATFAKLNAPQPTEGGGKIEVIEFFWYGCPHCY
jgi:thiol:disulfide interchange protein DsbA